MLPSRAVNNYYIILNVSVIKYVHRLHYVWFQNNPGQVNISATYIQTLIRRQEESMVNCTRINYA